MRVIFAALTVLLSVPAWSQITAQFVESGFTCGQILLRNNTNNAWRVTLSYTVSGKDTLGRSVTSNHQDSVLVGTSGTSHGVMGGTVDCPKGGFQVYAIQWKGYDQVEANDLAARQQAEQGAGNIRALLEFDASMRRQNDEFKRAEAEKTAAIHRAAAEREAAKQRQARMLEDLKKKSEKDARDRELAFLRSHPICPGRLSREEVQWCLKEVEQEKSRQAVAARTRNAADAEQERIRARNEEAERQTAIVREQGELHRQMLQRQEVQRQRQEALRVQAEEERRNQAIREARADMDAAVARSKATATEAEHTTKSMTNNNANLADMIKNMK